MDPLDRADSYLVTTSLFSFFDNFETHTLLEDFRYFSGACRFLVLEVTFIALPRSSGTTSFHKQKIS